MDCKGTNPETVHTRPSQNEHMPQSVIDTSLDPDLLYFEGVLAIGKVMVSAKVIGGNVNTGTERRVDRWVLMTVVPTSDDIVS